MNNERNLINRLVTNISQARIINTNISQQVIADTKHKDYDTNKYKVSMLQSLLFDAENLAKEIQESRVKTND